MRYTITRLSRTVNLDDELVNEYLKYDELREQPFAIVVRTKFGHAPTVEEVDDKDLSDLCNKILLNELTMLGELPKVIEKFEKHYEEIKEASKQGKLLDYRL